MRNIWYRAKKRRECIQYPFCPPFHSSLSLEFVEWFASLYVVVKSAVSLLYFLPLSSSFSSCFLFFFSTRSEFGASFNVPLFLTPLKAFPSQLLGVCCTQRPSHLPPVSLEHQNHLFPFHILVHVSCRG